MSCWTVRTLHVGLFQPTGAEKVMWIVRNFVFIASHGKSKGRFFFFFKKKTLTWSGPFSSLRKDSQGFLGGKLLFYMVKIMQVFFLLWNAKACMMHLKQVKISRTREKGNLASMHQLWYKQYPFTWMTCLLVYRGRLYTVLDHKVTVLSHSLEPLQIWLLNVKQMINLQWTYKNCSRDTLFWPGWLDSVQPSQLRLDVQESA